VQHPFDGIIVDQSNTPASADQVNESTSAGRRSFLARLAAAVAGLFAVNVGASAEAREWYYSGRRWSGSRGSQWNRGWSWRRPGSWSRPRRPTTYAVGEEGSGRATTYAVGEEGSGRPTTYAVGEEGSGGTVTTYAVGEEGSGGRPTTMAVGEEGGR
jgi:hypothetical protein